LFNFEENPSINAIIGDAQSSILAECAFNLGDLVITMGTGAFLSVNIGSKPLASHNGAYPLVGFKHKNDKIYLLHNNLSNCGTLIEWAKSNSLFENYNDIDNILQSTLSSNGIVFIIKQQPEIKFNKNFVGINKTSTNAQLLHAIVDSIVFSIKERYNVLLEDMKLYNIPINSIRICGGVSESDFICQYLADVLGHKIERSMTSSKSSSIGAAICAGLGIGLWACKEDLVKQRKNLCIFTPKNEINYNEQIDKWKQYQN
jgi:glycerol kinase